MQFRVLYADTDKMGIAYHGAFFRYMEMARVELLRAVGLPYTEMEKLGLGLPLSDTAVRFRRPAHYDDLVTIHAGLVLASRVRVHFQYRFEVAAGDRADAHEAIEILIAETRHACVRREDARIERMPIAVHERLRAAMT